VRVYHGDKVRARISAFLLFRHVVLVHSFSQEHAWLEDYQSFLALLGKDGGTFIGKRAG
jgi:hypothetical protein